MPYYAQYDSRNDNLYKAEVKCLADFIENIEVSKEVYDNLEKYIYSNGEIVLNPDYPAIELNNAKLERIAENDAIRDEVLNAGVTYNNVLFDSDTDQKINLLAIVGTMSENDTVAWYGKDNEALLCTKEDLVAIGALITELHSFCWNNNAYIKEQIENAKTMDELNAINISYDINK